MAHLSFSFGLIGQEEKSQTGSDPENGWVSHFEQPSSAGGLPAAIRPAVLLVDAPHGELPTALLFPQDPGVGRRRPAADRFETLSWVSDHPLSLQALQRAIAQLAPKLARAKGPLETVEQPGRQMLFQLAGGRATLASTGSPPTRVPPARMVFIAEIGRLSADENGRGMAGCAAPERSGRVVGQPAPAAETDRR